VGYATRSFSALLAGTATERAKTSTLNRRPIGVVIFRTSPREGFLLAHPVLARAASIFHRVMEGVINTPLNVEL
jgi:hypothetical protein